MTDVELRPESSTATPTQKVFGKRGSAYFKEIVTLIKADTSLKYVAHAEYLKNYTVGSESKVIEDVSGIDFVACENGKPFSILVYLIVTAVENITLVFIVKALIVGKVSSLGTGITSAIFYAAGMIVIVIAMDLKLAVSKAWTYGFPVVGIVEVLSTLITLATMIVVMAYAEKTMDIILNSIAVFAIKQFDETVFKAIAGDMIEFKNATEGKMTMKLKTEFKMSYVIAFLVGSELIGLLVVVLRFILAYEVYGNSHGDDYYH